MNDAAVSINFDSLAEAYGYPEGFRDRAFARIGQRFLDLADRHGIRYTIFVIGRDLDNADNRAAVREWAARGHEIANHSWSHRPSLGALGRDAIRREVGRAHEAIAEAAGREPRGFVAPGWSLSRRLLDVLVEFGYTYDSSAFPSWLLFPAIAKAALNHLGDARVLDIPNRRDYGHALIGRRRPFWYAGSLYRAGDPGRPGLVMLPLPTTRHRMACWHTLGFLFGWRRQTALVRACLDDLESFYYVVHPADLMGPDDLDGDHRLHLERPGGTLDDKLARLDEMFTLIREGGRRIVTMEDLATQWRARVAGGPSAGRDAR